MEPIKKIRNRWYYSNNVYINVNSGYYELCKNGRFIRSYSSLYDAIEGAKFLVRTLVKEITIHSDEQYGGHWIETDTKTYYFSQNTTLTQVFDMLVDEDNVGKH